MNNLGIYLLIDEKTLRIPASEIVRTHVLIVGITRLAGCTLYDRSHTTLGEINQRLTAIDIFGVLITVDVTFHVLRKIGISRLFAVARGIFSFRNAKTIVFPVVSAFDVFRLYLTNFKRSKPNVTTQLDDEIVAMVCSGSP
ncbi:hypothetical protein HT576_05295 [Haloterrigena sp. SYSU A121-1]|uniref:Uncharacterized protein n=1 Tax=Haloterrigena gelatinilytica TaxID=2741724 RepID=A0A8J8KGV3_9EURY|nr:hypothetical protein [Haloterrigena gelatinilytica]NUB90449.1 hypothetical protein [Haloterrigena gelatinilytica]